MHKTRLNPFLRLTALGVSLSLFGLTLAPLAHAQAAADSKAKPAEAPAPKPAAAPQPKPAAAPQPKALDAKAATTVKASEGTTADVKAKEPDKKTREAARKAYAQGEKLFAAGDYAGAYTSFEQANMLIPAPHAEYWMAKSLDKQDRAAEAAAAYEKFLGSPEASRVGEEKLTDAKTRLSELKAKLVAQIDIVTVPLGAVVLVDGNPEPGTTPMTLKLPPGPHRLTVSANGFETREIEIDAKPGEKVEQKIELAAKPPPPAPTPPPSPEPVIAPAPPPPPQKRSLVPAFVTLGIAAAGATVGTIFGLQALSAKSDFNDNPTTDAADDAERNALISDMAFGVAITLGVTGIVLLTSSDEAPAETAKKSPYKFELGARAGKDSGSASARITF
jgi:hypothetical protein